MGKRKKANAVRADRDLHARLRETQDEGLALRADLRETSARLDELLEERDVLVALVLRGAREIREPKLRANLLEDLEAQVPGALADLRPDERPEALRRRAAMRSTSRSDASGEARGDG